MDMHKVLDGFGDILRSSVNNRYLEVVNQINDGIFKLLQTVLTSAESHDNHINTVIAELKEEISALIGMQVIKSENNTSSPSLDSKEDIKLPVLPKLSVWGENVGDNKGNTDAKPDYPIVLKEKSRGKPRNRQESYRKNKGFTHLPAALMPPATLVPTKYTVDDMMELAIKKANPTQPGFTVNSSYIKETKFRDIKQEQIPRYPRHNPYDTNNNAMKSEHFIEYTKYLNNGIPIKNYDCVKCGGSFTRMSQLDSHIMRKHKEVRGFSCPYCEHSSVSTESLDKHIYSKHPLHGNNSKMVV